MSETARKEENRRALIAQQRREATGIDERMIEQLVREFYSHVREDDLLGPVFASRIHHWEPHLRRMCDFWSSVVLSSGVYAGQPMRLHLPLPIDAAHFDRWLALFERTTCDLFGAKIAHYFIEPARRIASSLEYGIANSRGVLLGRGERFHHAAAREGDA